MNAESVAIEEGERSSEMQQSVDLALLRNGLSLLTILQGESERSDGFGDDPDGGVGFYAVEKAENVRMSKSSEFSEGIFGEGKESTTVLG